MMRPIIITVAATIAALTTSCSDSLQSGEVRFDYFTLSTIGNDSIEKTDAFTGATLSDRWQYILCDAEAQTDLVSIKKTPGKLTLRDHVRKDAQIRVETGVFADLKELVFDCRTGMHFEAADTTERAGIAVYGDDSHQYRFCVGDLKNGGKVIEVRKVGDENMMGEILSRTVVICDNVELRVLSPNSNKFVFCYAPDGNAWIAVYDDAPVAYIADCKGDARIGLFIR